MKELQSEVARAVEARGYRQGWTDEQYAARQICKVVEELGELVFMGIGWKDDDANRWARHMEELGRMARDDFDAAAWQWERVQYVDAEEVARELPDVIIPLLVLADTLGIDLEQAIRAKALGDVARGVRGERPETQEQWVPLSELRPGAIFETQDGVRAVKRWSGRLYEENRICEATSLEATSLEGGAYLLFHNSNLLPVREIVL